MAKFRLWENMKIHGIGPGEVMEFQKLITRKSMSHDSFLVNFF